MDMTLSFMQKEMHGHWYHLIMQNYVLMPKILIDI